MNDDELNRVLRDAKTPELSDDYLRNFPREVIENLKLERDARPSMWPWRFGTIVVAAACGLFVGFVLWHRHLPSREYDALRDGRILSELQTQYPGRLQAIIQDASGVHTQLSPNADVSMSHPILLEIRDGTDHSVIVTFSGQVVRCGGRNVMVLSDGGGQVMLVGDEFFWSHQGSAGRAEKIQIHAEQFDALQVKSKPTPDL